MRLGELVRIERQDINFEDCFLTLWDTKNGDKRDVPLSDKALALLRVLVENKKPKERLFPYQSESLGVYFREVRKKAGLEKANLTFHDSRHEAATRLAEKLSNVLELSAVTGHKTLQNLKRYYNPRAKDLAKKLN
jgi:integrase